MTVYERPLDLVLGNGPVDLESGIALDVPFGLQPPDGWWVYFPELYTRLVGLREAMGIVVEDDMLYDPEAAEPIERPARRATPRTRKRKGSPRIRRRSETKAGVRKVRDPEFWGLPYGTPIVAGMKPRGEVLPNKKPRTAPGPKKVAQKPAKAPSRRTGGSGRSTTAAPRQIATPKPKGTARVRAQLMHERDDVWAHGVQRAWGPANDDQFAVRSNVAKGTESIEYASPKRLQQARELAIERARTKAPQPSEWDIRDNKRVNAIGGAGSSTASDTLRGDMYQRAANSWAVYVAYGGYDADKGKDLGFVPCVGCGMKMTWHSSSKHSKFPKFEQDKIITSTDGGSYNPQNIVPMCAGCNNQRGPKKFWESPVFREAKPDWYDSRKYQSTLKKTDREMAAFIKKNFPKGLDPKNKKHHEKLLAEFGRPKGKEYGRPAKEVPPLPYRSPPGPSRNRPNTKEFDIMYEFKSSVGRRAADFEYKDDWESPNAPAEVTSTAADGDRIQAKQLNWDGSNPNLEVPEYADETMVGRYVKQDVDSAFGRYTQHLLVKDDGSIRFIDPATIAVVASGDVGEEKAFQTKRWGKEVEKDSTPGFRDPDLSKYWTRGAGLAKWAKSPHPYTALVRALRAKGVPAKHVHGLAARYFKKVFGIWPGQRKKGKG